MTEINAGNRLGMRLAVTATFVIAVLLVVSDTGVTKVSGGNTADEVVSVSFQESDDSSMQYRNFSHKTKAHRKSCSSCHKFPSANWKRVRDKSDAFPDITEYPKHQSCINCHRRQFFSGAKPQICSICHVSPGPRNSRRHAFPNPREIFDLTAKGKRSFTKFNVYFPHEKHQELFGTADQPAGVDASDVRFVKASFGTVPRRNESCAVCHQIYSPQGDSKEEFHTTPPKNLGDGFWLKKGTFMSSPISHAQCFTCHSADTGIEPTPASCNVCHRLPTKSFAPDYSTRISTRIGIDDKLIIASWRKRESSGKFQHEFPSHKEMDCASCHSAPETLRTKRTVTIDSCNYCHITETTEDGGVLNYEIDQRKANPKFECIKCHLDFGREKIPKSHLEIINGGGGD